MKPNTRYKHDRVIIVTALRLKAVHMVSSPDLTHDKGYLSLLSNLGALVAITTCSAPVAYSFFQRLWKDNYLQYIVSRLAHFGSRSSLFSSQKRNAMFMSHLRKLRRNKLAIAARGKKYNQLDAEEEP